jgi:hypothetical protein
MTSTLTQWWRLETRELLKIAPHTLLSYQGSIRPG